jgi:3-deoxy-D-manno-octulosonic-acid transferase
MANFREIAALVVESKAGIQVSSAAQLEEALARLVRDPAERQRLGANGLEMIRTNGGATARHIEVIETVFGS